MSNGTISINAQNIMPVIKKWLYSDKDIFLREIVSNGCDAISKHKLLVMKGEAAEETDYRVTVTCDAEKGTLTISDNGIGMTADEIVKYICQVAFSGAEEFLKQYKPEEGENGGIIGHFGLGFYSAFMVAAKVEIDTKSYKDEPAAHWVSEDGMSYEITESGRSERGTDIILYLNDEEKDFSKLNNVKDVLDKYCAFMPVPIYADEIKPPKAEEEAKDEEKKDEKEPEAPKPINETAPLWLKRPTECTDEEYKAFYSKVFHDYEEPLFWIHLNAEFPFNLKGILFFPRIRNEFSAGEGQVKLFSNQVFVADNIKEIIPEFLLLLKGVVDCPDLPLNVSRSFLQNDGYVKKLSAYITRKVADRLTGEFNTKREEYQKYWDDIHPFVKYGCMKDEKFHERVKDVILFKTTEDEYLTLKEYGDRNFKDDKKLIYYCSDAKRQAQLVKLYRAQETDVVVMNTLIDNNFMSFMEYSGGEGVTFKRVDADMEGLTESGAADEDTRKSLEEKLKKLLNDTTLSVKLEKFKSEELPAMITVEEQSRRFSEMAKQWGNGMSMPEQRTLILNSAHPLVSFLKDAADEDELSGMVANQILDLAEMSRQYLEPERMVAFIERSNKLLTMLAKK